MEQLTKENFWDEAKEKWPSAMNHFCKWIDAYKKKVNWTALFGETADTADNDFKWVDAKKYHDIPGEMQYGIFLLWVLESTPMTFFKFVSIELSFRDLAMAALAVMEEWEKIKVVKN